MIERLLRALVEAGPAPTADPGPEELADILWLAACLDSGSARTPAGPAGAGAADEQAAEAAAAPEAGPREQHYATADLATPAGRPADPPSQDPPADGTGDAPAGRRGELVRVPRAAALADPLAVMRALRPLGRRTLADSRGTPELDEEATAGAGADQRLIVPVLRPAPGRWLDLALVIDTHRSMALWHDLVAELRRVIAQTGVFRDLRVWYLSGTEAGGTPALAGRPGGTPRRPQEIADPSGRRLVLVVTDTVAGGWGGSALDGVLRAWGRHGSVALLNVLPERLWSRGAVRPVPLHLRATGAAVPNTAWEAEAAAGRSRSRRRREAGPDTATGTGAGRPMPVPVVDTSPQSLALLAGLVAGGGRRSRLSCLLAGEPAPGPVAAARPPGSAGAEPPVSAGAEPSGSAGAEPPAAELALKSFRETASPLAQQLAGHLAAVPLVLPAMTLVRRAMLPGADHGHLAEVLLGGLLRPWSAPAPGTDPDLLKFEFLPGVREALLGSQRRADFAELQQLVRREVGAYLAAHRHALADFPAARTGPDAVGDREVDGAALPFAESGPTAPQSPTESQSPAAQQHPAAPQAPAEPDPGALLPLRSALADPSALGVLLPEQLPGLPELTPYLERAPDGALGRAVEAARTGEFVPVLVTGPAGAGKTRACLEALRRLPDDRLLWCPATTAELAAPPDLDPATVVWLDDVDALLDPDDPRFEEAVTALEELAAPGPAAPRLILATARTTAGEDRRTELPGFDRHHLVHLTADLTRADAAAAAQLDPRLAEAAALADRPGSARGGEVFPLLAAVPLLRRSLERAPSAARAVLTAAVDAVRLGHGQPLPLALLRSGSLGYVPDAELADRPADWFETAVGYAAAPVAGSPGLLTVVGTAGVGDALCTLHPAVLAWWGPAREPVDPPDQLWQALAKSAEPGYLPTLAAEAGRRGLGRHADALTAARRRRTRLARTGSADREDGSARPYFYLSYAHTPRTGEGSVHWERRLFLDLCEEILQLTTVPAGAPVGVMDDSPELGERWRERARELATCRVFVPLFSPRYFGSELCGKEWQAFARRPVYPSSVGAERTSAIVPVLWAPPARLRLPPVASALQLSHVGFGPDYGTEGMNALMRLSYYRPSYEVALHRLARRIVEVAESTVVPVGRSLDLADLPSAFPAPRPHNELRILVLSCRRAELPSGRDPRHYGERRTDWNPFGPAATGSLADRVAWAVRSLGYRPTVEELGADGGGPQDAPALLLLDGFALLDERGQALLRELGQDLPGWVVALQPWGPGDRAAWEGLAAARGVDRSWAARGTPVGPDLFDDEVRRAAMAARTFRQARPEEG
ncbi:TIR-like protein FxsC [Kitasatospora sp. NPDC054939]